MKEEATYIQGTLFGKARENNKGKTKSDFYDYDSFVKKFNADAPKTTDDCYTPQDVYEAVLEWVDANIVSLKEKKIIRPFFPGGDFENTEYPDDCVVIDNPPFSLMARILRFYQKEKVPFFLFANALTIFNSLPEGCTAIIIAKQIRYDNGAQVNTGFVTNLLPTTIAMTSPSLDVAIMQCESQKRATKKITAYKMPREIVKVSHLQTICRGGIDFKIPSNEAVILMSCGGVHQFGGCLLVSSAKAAAEERAKAAAERAKEERVIKIQLSEQERLMVEKLNSVNNS